MKDDVVPRERSGRIPETVAGDPMNDADPFGEDRARKPRRSGWERAIFFRLFVWNVNTFRNFAINSPRPRRWIGGEGHTETKGVIDIIF